GAPIRIQPYAMIGMSARLMPGVTIGRGSIVHAECEVTTDVPPFANFGGLPRGRQIGWRMPRRKSPRWQQPATQRAPRGGYIIRELRDPNDSDASDGVLWLHFSALAKG